MHCVPFLLPSLTLRNRDTMVARLFLESMSSISCSVFLRVRLNLVRDSEPGASYE